MKTRIELNIKETITNKFIEESIENKREFYTKGGEMVILTAMKCGMGNRLSIVGEFHHDSPSYISYKIYDRSLCSINSHSAFDQDIKGYYEKTNKLSDEELLSHYRAVATYTMAAIEQAQDQIHSDLLSKNQFPTFCESAQKMIDELEVHLNAITSDEY